MPAINQEVFYMKGQIEGLRGNIAEVKADLAMHRSDSAREFINIGVAIQDLKDVITQQKGKEFAWKQIRAAGWALAGLGVSLWAGVPAWFKHHI